MLFSSLVNSWRMVYTKRGTEGNPTWLGLSLSIARQLSTKMGAVRLCSNKVNFTRKAKALRKTFNSRSESSMNRKQKVMCCP